MTIDIVAFSLIESRNFHHYWLVLSVYIFSYLPEYEVKHHC